MGAVRVEATGFVGKDSEIKEINAGTLTVFSLGCTRRIRQPDASWIDGETIWFQVSIFGDYSDIRKGMQLMVSGTLEVSNYTDKEGKQANSLKLYADQIAQVIRKAAPQVGDAFNAPIEKVATWAEPSEFKFDSNEVPF